VEAEAKPVSAEQLKRELGVHLRLLKTDKRSA